VKASLEYDFEAADKSLRHYLRALWDREFKLHPCEKPLTQIRPFISELGIHLPRQYRSHQGQLAKDLYRAAAAHAAAHQAYSFSTFERKKLKPVQQAIIGLLEDARVELLAIKAMPGLRTLWLSFFDARHTEGIGVESLLLRLAHALLDPTREDDNPWVMKGRRLFAEFQQQGSDMEKLREIGSLLGNDIGQSRVQFNSKAYVVEPLYRDDNLFLWDSDAPEEETRLQEQAPSITQEAPQSAPKNDDKSEEDQRFRPHAMASANQEDDSGTDKKPLTYPEWDMRTGHYRPHWCSIIEQVVPAGDAAPLRARLTHYKALSTRLAQLMQARKIGQPVRLRGEPDGDDFELDALIKAQTALRSGAMPELRVHRRQRLQKRDLSILVLLDLSESTNAALGDASVLSLIREASVLLGAAIEQTGDQFAIHGFRSNGRHEVNYLRFKEFHQAFDDAALGRLAQMQGALSTRMGAAIRHATYCMRGCRTEQRLILVVTDGEPHDIDVFHPEVLLQDAARAVERSAAAGTPVFCVSVDAKADNYIRRIFGPHGYLVIDKLEQLPQRLPELYLRLTA
jgi:Mg-chelatase subunit ChlD